MANRRKKSNRRAVGAIFNVRFRWAAAGVACAAAVSILASVSCKSSAKRQSTSPPRPPARQIPWWETEGLVVALSPRSAEEQAWLMTQRRSKKPTRDELAAYDRIHGEESLRALADAGVNMLVFPYGGYDPDANEVEARDRAVEVARRCRAVGLRVGVIIPVGTIQPERWTEADPATANVLALSRTGRPYPVDTLGRLMTSRISAWERDRTDRLVREAVQRIEPDVVFLPDFTMAANSEPASLAAYKEYAKRRLAAEPPIPVPPAATQPNYVAPRRPDDTRGRLWTEYRVECLRNALADAARAARDVKPDVLIGLQGQGLQPQISVLDGAAVHPPSLWPPAELLWFDERIRVGQNGQVTHHVAPYKAAPAVIPMPRSKVEAAEALAFNHGIVGCIAFLVGEHIAGDPSGVSPPRDYLAATAQFSRRNRILWRDQTPMSDVRLYQSSWAAMHRLPASELIGLQTESALVSHHVPFEIVTAGSEPAAEVAGEAGSPLIMLGGQALLSDDEIAYLSDRVGHGVGLVLVGPCGTHDPYGKERKKNLVAILRERAASAEDIPGDRYGVRLVFTGPPETRVIAMSRPGPMPNVWPKVPRPQVKPFEPRPHRDAFYEAVGWVAGSPPRLTADLPQSVAVELTRSPTADRIVLHRVNFDRRIPAPQIAVTLRIPPGRRVTAIRRYELESGEPAEVSFTQSGQKLEFSAAALPLYDAHLIETAAK